MAYRDFPCFEAILWSGENSIGPRTFCGAKSRVYDGFNRLRQVRKGGTTAQYTYNAEGIRTAKTVNGERTTFILDGANVIGEVNAQNQVTNYIRGASGIILSRDQSNTTKYYVTNGHGDVMGLTDTTGAVVKSYEYDAFGQEYSPSSGDTNPFRYCGEYFDSETNSIYLRARYYSPAVGRFTQQDPAMDGINWYVYCASNPVNAADPTGLGHCKVVLAAGINTNADKDMWYWMKNEITYRLNKRGDTVEFIEVYPYGEGKDTGVIGQSKAVLDDVKEENHKGGDHVNWKVTEADVAHNESLIMIGHSGGGVAVIDAYSTMDDYHKSKVKQVVSVGSPVQPITNDSDKHTQIFDRYDGIPATGAVSKWRKNPADRVRMIDGGYKDPLYAHTGYFDKAEKSADILNTFWDQIGPC